jgi:hypothetical protein
MAQQETSSQFDQLDEIQRRQIRLWLFVVLILWTFTAITAPVIAFCITRSPVSFSLFSILTPPVYLWYRIAKYALMDERMYELERMKIQRRISPSNGKVMHKNRQED